MSPNKDIVERRVRMDSMILQQVEKMGIAEKRELLERLKALIAEEMAGSALRVAPDRCPRCGSSDYIRKGHDAHGLQRWKCRSCGRTFSAKTGSVLAMSKLDAATWAEYAEGTLSGMSLRELADRCNVCLRTSWFMRMRLFEVMESALGGFRYGPSVSCQADGLYLDESLAGNRERSDIQMPRKAHTHGHAVHSRGISSLKVCVECCVNDLGDEYAAVCGRGRPTDDELKDALSGIVDSSWVATDDHAGYVRVLPALGVSEHTATVAKESTHGELGLVNAMHQRLREFLLHFHGVSTKWLGHYLACFLWIEQAKHSERDKKDTLSGQLAGGRYVHTRHALIEMEQPFWSYWKDGTATSIEV